MKPIKQTIMVYRNHAVYLFMYALLIVIHLSSVFGIKVLFNWKVFLEVKRVSNI